MEMLRNLDNPDELVIKMTRKEFLDLCCDMKPFFEFSNECLKRLLNSPR